MKFNKINLSTWNRTATYNHFMSDVPCTYSMSVNLNISKLIQTVKEKGIKLFPACLYGISAIVNHHSESRTTLDEQGNPGWYDVSNPCYTVFHKQTESFTNVWTEYNENFYLFYQNYISDIELYGDTKTLSSKALAENNIFNVSCIPWTSFTAFNLNLKNGYDYLPLIFTIGKYYKDNNSISLPLAIQVHHAVCDGFQTARFVNELQDLYNNFC